MWIYFLFLLVFRSCQFLKFFRSNARNQNPFSMAELLDEKPWEVSIWFTDYSIIPTLIKLAASALWYSR